MKILVLAGGLSPERDVSLTTGSLVARALLSHGHEICLCDLYTGKGYRGETPVFSQRDVEPYAVERQEPDLTALKQAVGYGDKRIAPGIIDLCRKADVVFIALHGDVGENGMLQAMLDMEGIAYTGSGYVGSLLAMDKDLSKQLFVRAGVTTAPWIHFSLKDDAEKTANAIEQTIGYPCVVKPLACGSSVGVSMSKNRAELTQAIRYAAKYGDTALAEVMIHGRELTVSILGDRVLPPVEIIPLKGFYDYENKYQKGATTEICPASLTDEQVEAMNAAAIRAFRALRLRGYARFDFIMDENNVMWCLEGNTLPGLTPTSLLPQEAAAAGLSYADLCEEIIRLATV